MGGMGLRPHFTSFRSSPPFASLSGRRAEVTSESLRAFVRRCWFDYHVRSAKALRLGQPSVCARLEVLL